MAISAIYQHHERTTTATLEADLQLREIGIDPVQKFLTAYSEVLGTKLRGVTQESPTVLFTGTLGATGNFAINTNKFTVTASSGDTSVAGTLGVTALITATGGLVLAGGSSTAAGLWKSAIGGLALRAATGSSYDLTLEGAAGNTLLRNPTGTFNLDFPQATGTTTFSGPLVASSTLLVSGHLSLLSSQDILIADNVGAALTIKEGGNPYLRFVTTDGSEKISAFKAVDMSSTLDVTGNVHTSGTGTGYWMNSLGVFTYGMYTSGTDLRFRSGSTTPFLTVTSAGLPTFANAVTMSSTLGVTGATTLSGLVGVGVSPSASSSMDIRNAGTSGVSQYCLTVQSTFTSGATTTGTALYSQFVSSGAFSMATGRGHLIATPSVGSTTVTDLVGLDVQTMSGGTNNYAIRTGASGLIQLNSLTASSAVATDASKNLVSVTNTGTGNNVLSASPTLTGTIGAASMTLSGSLTIGTTATTTGVHTFTAAPVFSSATASQAVFTNGSKALVSNAITGTGNVVMSASPTLTGTIAAAAMTLSSTLGVTGNVGVGGAATSDNLDVYATLVGTVVSGVRNLSTNASAHARLSASTASSAAGDPSVLLTVLGSTDWAVGIDNSDSDKLKIGNSYLIGTNTAITIDTAQAVTMSSTLAVTGDTTLSGYLARSVQASITASTTHTQGQGALTKDINIVSTVANVDDTVTLPPAQAGRIVIIINRGAYGGLVFPASGDIIYGNAVNVADTMDLDNVTTFIAEDATTWHKFSYVYT